MPIDRTLLTRIEAFDIDGGPADFSFADRLARDNGWSRAYAERVITEYKRFMLLTVTHGRAVCPSEDVDEAWHLHLTFTRSYWQRFCKETLGTEVHHEPTRGGPAEHAKHVTMYEDTLAAYARAFGTWPPADIWPAAAKRFAPKRSPMALVRSRFARAAAVLGFAAAGMVGATSSFGSINPFELEGIEFLNVLVPAMLVAIIAGRLLYPVLRGPGSRPGDSTLRLDWAEAAYLAGGAPRLTTAAIARLVETGAAQVTTDRSRLEPAPSKPTGLSPVEQAVLDGLPIHTSTQSSTPRLAVINRAVDAAFRSRARSLVDRGLILSPAQQKRSFLMAIAPLALVLLLLAFPRLFSGLSKGLPVSFLVLAGGVITIFGLLWIKSVASSNRSKRGEAVLASMRARHDALKSADTWGSAPALVGGTVAGAAVALFGTSALAGTSVAGLDQLDDFFPRRTTAQSSGCGTGCSGGSGGGSGGGGGGGCGGCGGGGGGD